jgi:GNAT superfamily N-acetyltransferase
MSYAVRIRLATIADVELISWHRARMFRDMGELPPDLFESFRAQSRETLQWMFERGEYVGRLASPESEPDKVIAGAGVQLREVPPHPQINAHGKIDIVSGRQAIIQNVFTEPDWRRRGLAGLLNKEDSRLDARERDRFAGTARIRRRPRALSATRLCSYNRNAISQLMRSVNRQSGSD